MNGKGSAGLGSPPGPCKSARASVSAARASPFNFFNYSLLLQDPFFHLFKRNRSVGLSWAACILRGSFIIVPCLNGRQRVSLKSPSATSPSKYLNRSLMGSQPDPPGSRGGFVSARRGGTATAGRGVAQGTPGDHPGRSGGGGFGYSGQRQTPPEQGKSIGQTGVRQRWSSPRSFPCSHLPFPSPLQLEPLWRPRGWEVSGPPGPRGPPAPAAPSGFPSRRWRAQKAAAQRGDPPRCGEAIQSGALIRGAAAGICALQRWPD